MEPYAAHCEVRADRSGDAVPIARTAGHLILSGQRLTLAARQPKGRRHEKYIEFDRTPISARQAQSSFCGYRPRPDICRLGLDARLCHARSYRSSDMD